MEIESIKSTLEIMLHYDTVNIKQVFINNEKELLEVRCPPATQLVEVVCLQTDTVTCYNSIEEAAVSIAKYNDSKRDD